MAWGQAQTAAARPRLLRLPPRLPGCLPHDHLAPTQPRPLIRTALHTSHNVRPVGAHTHTSPRPPAPKYICSFLAPSDDTVGLLPLTTPSQAHRMALTSDTPGMRRHPGAGIAPGSENTAETPMRGIEAWQFLLAEGPGLAAWAGCGCGRGAGGGGGGGGLASSYRLLIRIPALQRSTASHEERRTNNE